MTSQATNLDSARVTASTVRARPHILRELLGYSAAFLVGAALLVAAWSKSADPQGFATQMIRDGMAPAWGGMFLALAVVALEWGLGVALVIGLRRPLVLGVSTLLMAAFLGIAVFELVFPPEDPSSCGCFGNFVQQDPVQHATTNGVLFLLSLLAWLGRSSAPGRKRWIASIAAAVLGFAFAVAAPSLPIDGWPGVTMLTPGASLDDLPIADTLPEAATGRWLVLVIDRSDPATRELVPAINDSLALGGGPVNVVAIAENDPELATDFLFSTGPAFTIHDVSWGLMKPLYRKLPRSFVLDEGRVTLIWDRLPTPDEMTALSEGRLP